MIKNPSAARVRLLHCGSLFQGATVEIDLCMDKHCSTVSAPLLVQLFPCPRLTRNLYFRNSDRLYSRVNESAQMSADMHYGCALFLLETQLKGTRLITTAFDFFCCCSGLFRLSSRIIWRKITTRMQVKILYFAVFDDVVDWSLQLSRTNLIVATFKYLQSFYVIRTYFFVGNKEDSNHVRSRRKVFK